MTYDPSSAQKPYSMSLSSEQLTMIIAGLAEIQGGFMDIHGMEKRWTRMAQRVGGGVSFIYDDSTDVLHVENFSRDVVPGEVLRSQIVG